MNNTPSNKSSNSSSNQSLDQLAKTVLDSPKLQRQLCDRLYALLQAELYYQHDRLGHPYRQLL